MFVLRLQVDGSGKKRGRRGIARLVQVISKVELGDDEHDLVLCFGQLVQAPVVYNIVRDQFELVCRLVLVLGFD